MTDQAPPARDPWQEFADLLLGVPPVASGTPVPEADPTPDGNNSIYDGLDEADQFSLAVHLAAGGTLGVPDDYDVTPTPDLTHHAARNPT